MATAAPTPPGASPVREEFGPSLVELVGPKRARVVLVVAILAVLGLWLAYRGVRLIAGGEAERQFVHAPAPTFNFKHSDALTKVQPDRDGIVRFEQRRNGLFTQSFAVRALRLPTYRGEAAALLPLLADRHAAELARSYEGFRLVDEGKARVNRVPGYQVGFRVDLPGGRSGYGRDIFLVPDEPGARDGVILTLLSTPAGEVYRIADVGAVGAIKKPLRSFRFGTEARGGS